MTREEARAKIADVQLDDEFDVTNVVEEGGDVVVYVAYRGDLRFEDLDALSRIFGTRRIDLGYDRGPASDPSVDPYIVIRVAGEVAG